MMQSGLPKMMALVMTSLLISDTGSQTATELVQRLQVSPATISKSIAFLESQTLLRRERDERRRERYVIDDDIWYQSMLASVHSLTQQVELARQGVGVLAAGTPAAIRMESIARFLDFVSESLTPSAEQAREVLHARPETHQPDSE
ncbi:DeoR-like protein with HTH domain [Streptomyces sp. 846.5]|nr:DeoR-like protein with HTH domain [Streptomyces sp. 846.5]